MTTTTARRTPEGASNRLLLASRGTLAALTAVAAAAWAVVVFTADPMTMDDMGLGPGRAAAFVGAWVVMMAAMMLPSAAPLILLYRRGSTSITTALLAAGYLGVWAAVGVAAYAAHVAAMRVGEGTRPYVVAGVLVGAGVYELTPLKNVCLRHCRTPLDFLMQRWRSDRLGALRLGADHGAYCLGCCWALMAVLVIAGAMGLVWVVAIALVVAMQKLAPGGERLARPLAAALVALGVAVAVNPDLAMRWQI